MNCEVKEVGIDQLPEYAEVIRRGFATVAEDFGLTRENCPKHTSFISDTRLASFYRDGYYPFGCFADGGRMVGFIGLTDEGGGVFEMHNVSILPEYRHHGCGKAMLDFCKRKVFSLGGSKIILDMIEENRPLKAWYAANGFVHIRTEKFEGMPFTVGYMEWSVDSVDNERI